MESPSQNPDPPTPAPLSLLKLITFLTLIWISMLLATGCPTSHDSIFHGLWIHFRSDVYIRYGIWLSSESLRKLESYDEQGGVDIHPPPDFSLDATRSRFGRHGTQVYCWPSTGGVWVHEECYGVELDFLNISRFETSATARFSQDEDDFCQRLEWIGALFYESDNAYSLSWQSSQDSELWTAWPGSVPDGGLWALRSSHDEDPDMGIARIRNAHTMKERCEVIEMLGGRLYEKWEDVPKHTILTDYGWAESEWPVHPAQGGNCYPRSG